MESYLRRRAGKSTSFRVQREPPEVTHRRRPRLRRAETELSKFVKGSARVDTARLRALVADVARNSSEGSIWRAVDAEIYEHSSSAEHLYSWLRHGKDAAGHDTVHSFTQRMVKRVDYSVPNMERVLSPIIAGIRRSIMVA